MTCYVSSGTLNATHSLTFCCPYHSVFPVYFPMPHRHDHEAKKIQKFLTLFSSSELTYYILENKCHKAEALCAYFCVSITLQHRWRHCLSVCPCKHYWHLWTFYLI